MQHLYEVNLKDIIKKSSLSARDVEEKPSMSDCEVEKSVDQSEVARIGATERVRPERRDSGEINRDSSPKIFRPNKMSNVYYDTEMTPTPVLSETGKK